MKEAQSYQMTVENTTLAGETHHQESQKSLEVTERLSDRCSGDAPAVDGLQPERHFGRFRRRVLDHLGLVETDSPPVE